MISQSKNRVQAIRSKFENLSHDGLPQLSKHNLPFKDNIAKADKENAISYEQEENCSYSETRNDKWSLTSNVSLHNDLKKSVDAKKSLVRQSSDPGKKLHRRHAFRCDRSKIVSPKRHGSCYGRSETKDFSLKPEMKLSKDRLAQLGNLLEDQMRKENFIVEKNEQIVGQVMQVNGSPVEVNDIPINSIPDSEVPQHILDQYAKVVKPIKGEPEKQDGMIDSGVSSETENLDDDKTQRIKQIIGQFERPDSVIRNLDSMNELCASSETMKLERKNPHLTLTSTLKKALKQPLPPGPPPKKPPRTFTSSPEPSNKQKKDAKKMLEKLERVLQKREAQSSVKNEYDIAETNLSSREPKEMHYLCTEILDITNKTILPNAMNNCLRSLNCAITNNSTLSLPYTRLRTSSNRECLTHCCSCSNDNIYQDRVSPSFDEKCFKCRINGKKQNEFKCHLNCKCKGEMSQFFIDTHIYDEPFSAEERKSIYGTLNHSKSLEDLRCSQMNEDQKIYDIPCDISRPATPEEGLESPPPDLVPTTNYQKSPEMTLRSKLSNLPKSPHPSKPDPPPNSKPVVKIDHLKSIFENPGPGPEGQDLSPKKELSVKLDFEKLRQNFENDNKRNVPTEKIDEKVGTKKATINKTRCVSYGVSREDAPASKPPMKPKPIFMKKMSKSTENLNERKHEPERASRFSTVSNKYARERDGGRFSLPERDNTQLDVDRENLNQLMSEIYATVAACSMAADADSPASFPTDTDTSDDSVKVTRSLTEKRKNYVRRVSSRVAYVDTAHTRALRARHHTAVCVYKPGDTDHVYSTFRSWKSFRTSQNNLNLSTMEDDADSSARLVSPDGDSRSIDEKTGCVDIALPFEPRPRGLFNVCLLVGMNHLTGEAYVKNVFPAQVQVPAHIENLLFPETLAAATGAGAGTTITASGATTGGGGGSGPATQCYSLVLTDERGERSYGYCRRVLPEGAAVCLPLCYCIIGKYRAPGFYYKILQEIESHHGSSDVAINSILQQLFETDFPSPGEEISVTLTRTEHNRHSASLGHKCKTMPNFRRSGGGSGGGSGGDFDKSVSESEISGPQLYDDVENNNSAVLMEPDGPRTRSIKRPLEPRVDEQSLSVLLDSLGGGLALKVFASLLLERKVVICAPQLSKVSSCMEALQLALYPFVWQQPLISAVPAEIQRDVLGAPLPLLAGVLTQGLDTAGVVFEEGMLVDLSTAGKVVFQQGDEASILPAAGLRALKAALALEGRRRPDDASTRSVMISEAFLRFFVDILGDFWKYFSLGELRDGQLGKAGVVFDTESFIKNSPSKQNQYFLEWFTETAMFNHFIQNMAALYTPPGRQQDAPSGGTPPSASSAALVDAPLPDFYELFNDRLKNKTKFEASKFDKSNYKNAMNKKMKLLKNRLRELVA